MLRDGAGFTVTATLFVRVLKFTVFVGVNLISNVVPLCACVGVAVLLVNANVPAPLCPVNTACARLCPSVMVADGGHVTVGFALVILTVMSIGCVRV